MNTSFIERLNLTIRRSSAYLSRRTLAHARSTDTLDAHLELLRCYYNFVRPHRALKFGRETRTPAMQAGLATRRLTLRDIFVSLRRVVWWLSDVRVFADVFANPIICKHMRKEIREANRTTHQCRAIEAAIVHLDTPFVLLL